MPGSLQKPGEGARGRGLGQCAPWRERGESGCQEEAGPPQLRAEPAQPEPEWDLWMSWK